MIGSYAATGGNGQGEGMKVSLITDEVSQDLDAALDFGLHHGVRWFALRSVWGRTILQLTDAEVDAIRVKIEQRNVHVSGLMSPLFKCYLSGGDVSQESTGGIPGADNDLARRRESA
jgi:hypothetical protein